MPRSYIALVCLLAALAPATGTDSAPAPPSPGGTVGPAGRRAEALPLPFYYDLYTFRGPVKGRTTVVAAFAVPAGLLHREETRDGLRYRFDVTLVLADTALRTVSRTDDSVYVDFRRRPLAEHLLFTHIEVRAAPSRTTVERVIMTDATTPGVGQLYGAPFVIPDYGGDQLMLSDIALGLPDAATGWRRGDVTLALLPTSQFPASAFDVYYEVYNLPAGHRYLTEIAVEPAGYQDDVLAGERAVRLRFTGHSTARPDGVLPELRRVESSLERGRHRITVTITDERTGRAASNSRVFEVRGWGMGATLVPALPRRGG